MLSRDLPVYSYFISSHCLVLFRRGKTPRKTPRKARGPTDPVEVSTGGGSKNCYSCIHLQLKPMRLFRFHCIDKFSLMLYKIWVSSSATLCRAGENRGLLVKILTNVEPGVTKLYYTLMMNMIFQGPGS